MINKKDVITLIILLTIALFVNINFSKWSLDIDEIFTIKESINVDLESFSDYFTFQNIYLLREKPSRDLDLLLIRTYPLYYYLNHQIIKMFGTSEASLRFLSVFWGVAAVLFIYLLGKKFFNCEIALVMSLLILFHPLIQFHSQNARFYSMSFFFSLVVIWSTLKIREIMLDGQITSKKGIFLVLFGIILWLPMLIHGNMIFALVFPGVVLIDLLLRERTPSVKRKFLYLLPTLLVMGLIVGINQFIFLKRMISGVWTDPDIQGVKVYGSSLAHNVVSLLNNIGIHLWLIIPFGFIVFMKDKDRIFRTTFITLFISVFSYLLFSLKSSDVRVDYFVTALPFIIIIVSYTIVQIVNSYIKDNELSHMLKYMIATYLILLFLPSFASNFIIDGDRLNWKEAANYFKEIHQTGEKNKKMIIYSSAPGNLEFYLKDNNGIESKQIRLINIDQLSGEDYNYFIVIPLRRAGFDIRGLKKEIRDFIFKRGRIENTIGRDRLDIHTNKLVVLRLI